MHPPTAARHPQPPGSGGEHLGCQPQLLCLMYAICAFIAAVGVGVGIGVGVGVAGAVADAVADGIS